MIYHKYRYFTFLQVHLTAFYALFLTLTPYTFPFFFNILYVLVIICQLSQTIVATRVDKTSETRHGRETCVAPGISTVTTLARKSLLFTNAIFYTVLSARFFNRHIYARTYVASNIYCTRFSSDL